MYSKVSIAAVLILLLVCGQVLASGAISTDRFGYTGTVKRFATLADAQSGVNQVGDDIAISNRDLSLYIFNGYGGVDDTSIIMGSWWYTTAENTNGYAKDDPLGDRYYSGYGNTSGNSGRGWLQIYDEDASTDTSISMQFQNKVGSYWTEFAFSISGVNADYPNDYTRFWVDYQGSGADKVVYHEYDLSLVAGGLEGVETSPGVIEANNHPTSVTGTYSGIFENVSTTYTQNNGFYTFNLALDMDNWAFAQGDEALNGDFSDSYFATVPEPGTIATLLSGLAALAGGLIRRRKQL